MQSAGGSPYDIMVKFGASHYTPFESIWIIVDTINKHPSLHPHNIVEQQQVVSEF